MCPTFQVDELMASLPQTQQVTLLMGALGKYPKDEDRFWLFEALKRVLKDDLVELRKQLMAFYVSLYRPPKDASEERPSDAFVQTVLTEILQGWDWRSEEGKIQENTDAEECFLFFCNHIPNDKFRTQMLQVLREHINSRNPEHDRNDPNKPTDQWFYIDLDKWILHPHFSKYRATQEDILEVLLHARIRMGGGSNIREDMEFFASLGPHLDYYLAPPGCLALVQKEIEQVRTTYELLSHIGDPIAPEELTGKPNSDALLKSDDTVHWRWNSPELVKVTITFGSVRNQEAIERMEELAKELLKKTSLPFQIVVDAKGPESNPTGGHR